MATASSPLSAFAELSAHTLSLAVLSGRKVTALRTFSLEAKADITAFVTEHQLTGTTRVALLGAKNFLHPSSEQETATVRQPAALLSHLTRLPHGFESTPVSVVVDAATGLLPNSTQALPWIAAALPSAETAEAKEKLSGLGLTPAAITLAAPIQFGVIAGSLSAGEITLVVLPGEGESHLVWITSAGPQAIAAIPGGFGQIFEAVQTGLGLKFKTAAGKLFYNEHYDFGEAAPKVAAALAPAIQPFLGGTPATHLHLAALTPSQAWLTQHLAAALKLTPWVPDAASLASRLSLDAGSVTITPTLAGLLQLASAGTTDAAWVISPLQAQPANATAPAPAAPPAPIPVAKPLAPAAKVKEPASAKPPTPPAAAQPAAKTPPSPSGKSKLSPAIIGSALAALAAVVALVVYFTRSGEQPTAKEAPVAQAAPAPAPVAPPPPPPVLVSDDQFTTEPRKFGNDRYRFEVAEKGFIQALATTGSEVLVESAAGISLQGSYIGTDGRRKWFNVGGVDDAGYVASVTKSVQAGITVFDVKVTHPRFELAQTFTCLPGSIKVTARLTPINLRDPRGVIAAVHSVRLSPVALNPSVRMRATTDNFTYAMKAGPLAVTFDNGYWARDGSDGRQTIVAGENGIAFHFTDSNDPARNQLTYELSIP